MRFKRMKWRQCGIPEPLVDRVVKIFGVLGYKSVSDFVQKAVMDKLPREEAHFDEIQMAIKSGEAQKWEK
jgi:hypothetical protein